MYAEQAQNKIRRKRICFKFEFDKIKLLLKNNKRNGDRKKKISKENAWKILCL
jgi:hypothetical protein